MNREMKDSNDSMLGFVPANWEISRLKFHCLIKNGSEPSSEGDIPVFGSGKGIVKYCGEYKEGPTILLGRKGTLDKPKYIEGKFWNVDTVMDAYAKEGTNPKYLYYIATIFDIPRYATITAKPSMTQFDYYNMLVPTPLETEQDEIVRYIDGKSDNINEAISRHQIIIEKLEEYKRATIVTSVSGGLSSKDKKNSDIKWMPNVPTSWNVIPLWVFFKERKNKNSYGTETNLLSLSYGKIKRKDIDTKEGLLPENFNGYNIIEDGDIVLRLTDLQNDMRSLRTGLVTEHGIITSAYITLKPVAKLNSAYYHYLLHAYDIMKVFYSMGEGVRQNLNYNELCKMLLPSPSIPEQEENVEHLDIKCAKVNEAIARQKDAITKLEEYRKSIIYNAVTGKIDCRIGE